jgi:putative phosphoesterase
MKIMIASDIHGSAFYCSKLIKAFENEEAERLLLLGDLLYHGPRNNLPGEYDPKAVAAMLNNIRDHILCVRGNCDAEVDQMLLEFPIMAEYCILYAEKRMIFATHGHKLNPKSPPMLKTGDILLNGHTHIPACQDTGTFIYMNPGSVSIPKEHSLNSYMILEDESFIWKDIQGNPYKRIDL